MRFTVIAKPGAAHQVEHQHALMQGLAAHGIEAIRGYGGPVTTSHVACWGWRHGRRLRAEGREVLVMERGYLGDRFAWTSLGWNGLNGFAEFQEYPYDGGARFDAHYSLKPWNRDGRYALLMGQVPGDASLRGIDLSKWYADAAMKANNAYEMPVLFREHPMALRKGINRTPRMTEPSRGTLVDALAGAAVVITFNSNSAVDAVCAGIPAVAMDQGSMAWPVAAHRIGDLATPDRTRWAHRLAWCQWSMDEIRTGAALTGLLQREVACRA